MALPRFVPRRVVPDVVSGASSAHVVARLWRLSRAPARETPLHLFLARHSDVILLLCSSHVALWRLAKRHHQDNSITNGQHADTLTPSAPHDTVHQLRQVFTALLLGLGMITRRLTANKADTIPEPVQRLRTVVAEGIDLVNTLDSAADQTHSAR
jgi:hypothetical protein